MVYSRLHTSTHQRYVKYCLISFRNIALYSEYHALLSKRSCTALFRIFPKLGFLAGFSLYSISFIDIAGRISEAANGGDRGAQRLDFAC